MIALRNALASVNRGIPRGAEKFLFVGIPPLLENLRLNPKMPQQLYVELYGKGKIHEWRGAKLI